MPALARGVAVEAPDPSMIKAYKPSVTTQTRLHRRPARQSTDDQVKIVAGVIACVVVCLCFLVCVIPFGSDKSDDEFAERVSPATPQQLDKIRIGLEDGFAISNGYMVKSRSHGQVYYVAARLQGPGVDDVAVWAVSGPPDAPRLTMSADNVAVAFSDWPKGSETKANAWITDEDCSKLRTYAEQQGSRPRFSG